MSHQILPDDIQKRANCFWHNDHTWRIENNTKEEMLEYANGLAQTIQYLMDARLTLPTPSSIEWERWDKLTEMINTLKVCCLHWRWLATQKDKEKQT